MDTFIALVSLMTAVGAGLIAIKQTGRVRLLEQRFGFMEGWLAQWTAPNAVETEPKQSSALGFPPIVKPSISQPTISSTPETEALIPAYSEPIEPYSQQEPAAKAIQQAITPEHPIRALHAAPTLELPEFQNSTPSKPSATLETRVGGKLSVWVGAVALVVAIVFLVRHSIEQGWATPELRVINGLAFGVGLIVGGWFLRNRAHVVARGMVSSAIVIIYASLWAATMLFGFIPPIAGIVAMAVTTTTAMLLSREMGKSVGLFGLIGGLVAPALVGTTEPNMFGLFTYLLVMQIGATVSLRKTAPFASAMFNLAAGTAWLVFFLIDGSTELIWPTLYLMGTAVNYSVPTLIRKVEDEKAFRGRDKFANVLMFMVTVGFVFAMLDKSDYAIAYWGALAAVSALAMYTAISRAGKMQLIAAIPGVFLLTGGGIHSDKFETIVPLAAVGLALFAIGRTTIHGKGNSAFWAAFAAFSAFCCTVGMIPVDVDSWTAGSNSWIASGVFFAVALSALPLRNNKEYLNAADVLVGAGLVAVGVFSAIYLQLHTWILLWSGIAALFGVWGALQKTAASSMYRLLSVSVLAFCSLLLPRLELLSESGGALVVLLIAVSTLSAIGLTRGLMSRKTSQVLNAEKLAVSVCGLLLLMWFLLLGIHVALHGKVSVSEITDIEFVAQCLVVLSVSMVGLKTSMLKFSEAQEVKSVVTLIGIGTSLILGLALTISWNPLISGNSVGEAFILNHISLLYLPAICTVAAIAWLLNSTKQTSISRAAYACAVWLMIVFLSLQVRHYFHGPKLASGETISAEHYSYSILWMLIAFSLLGFGMVRRQAGVRISGLLFLAFCTGKVFLFDMSHLTGLWRVASFLGLGISLMGLGYVYSRLETAATDGENGPVHNGEDGQQPSNEP